MAKPPIVRLSQANLIQTLPCRDRLQICVYIGGSKCREVDAEDEERPREERSRLYLGSDEICMWMWFGAT